MIRIKKAKLRKWILDTKVSNDYSHFHDIHIDQLVIGKCYRSQWIWISSELLDEVKKMIARGDVGVEKDVVLAMPLQETQKLKRFTVVRSEDFPGELNEYTPPSLYLFSKKKIWKSTEKIKFTGDLFSGLECFYTQYQDQRFLGVVSRTIWFKFPTPMP
ncbi:MAG: hypothetical protein Q8Q08_11875 [Candidatus Omnitrophota bacterium]|nr:hypothetical protein [Candidatus Omnitrophota bacterium]MDZ4241568.1 hypothetical protein [Candidatus Omnitrophota bacterium]